MPVRTEQVSIEHRVRETTTHSNAELCSPEATSRLQFCLHCAMSDRTFLSPRTFSIQSRKASSFSGMKNDDRRDRTVSKLADSEVI